MLSDDTFRGQRDRVIAHLHAWAENNRDLAAIEEIRTPRFWRLTLAPFTPNACPFELILRDDQRYDTSIGGEIYEDRPIERLDLFEPLLVAITAGRLVTRTWTTTTTGAVHTVETIVYFDQGTLTGARVVPSVADRVPLEACLAHDHHWLAYRR